MTIPEAIAKLREADPRRSYYVTETSGYYAEGGQSHRFSIVITPSLETDGSHESYFSSKTTLGNAVQAALDAIEAGKAVTVP